MGQRGEIFSTRVFVDEGRKTFFFNVKENRYHDLYLNVVESRKTDRGFRRSSIVIFREDLSLFTVRLESALAALKARRPPKEEALEVGGGRRQYRFRTPPRGRPALQITETRQDATGSRRESVLVTAASVDAFLDGFRKASGALKG